MNDPVITGWIAVCLSILGMAMGVLLVYLIAQSVPPADETIRSNHDETSERSTDQAFDQVDRREPEEDPEPA